MPNWLLPENIADVLPQEAREIEKLRRAILDNFALYGYELVIPPLLEYIDSLLTGTGKDLDLRTFKLVDQLSGRTMGLRADITPQVARIDAHLLNRDGVTRLCYSGSVLHTRPSGLHATREPFQIGAEIYGHAGIEADAEVHELALSTLAVCGIEDVRLDLSHAGLLRAILADDRSAKENEFVLYELMENKDIPGLKVISASFKATTATALLALTRLYGDVAVLEEARRALPDIAGVKAALDDLDAMASLAGKENVTIDLGDLRGYHYHSGAMFAAYIPGLPNAILRGGRYDHVGEVFGRARPATGFSMDLRALVSRRIASGGRDAISVPWSSDPSQRTAVAALRRAGEVVIRQFPGSDAVDPDVGCNRVLVCENENWVVKTLDQK